MNTKNTIQQIIQHSDTKKHEKGRQMLKGSQELWTFQFVFVRVTLEIVGFANGTHGILRM